MRNPRLVRCVEAARGTDMNVNPELIKTLSVLLIAIGGVTAVWPKFLGKENLDDNERQMVRTRHYAVAGATLLIAGALLSFATPQ